MVTREDGKHMSLDEVMRSDIHRLIEIEFNYQSKKNGVEDTSDKEMDADEFFDIF